MDTDKRIEQEYEILFGSMNDLDRFTEENLNEGIHFGEYKINPPMNWKKKLAYTGIGAAIGAYGMNKFHKNYKLVKRDKTKPIDLQVSDDEYQDIKYNRRKLNMKKKKIGRLAHFKNFLFNK
jgi:hypothetical protein